MLFLREDFHVFPFAHPPSFFVASGVFLLPFPSLLLLISEFPQCSSVPSVVACIAFLRAFVVIWFRFAACHAVFNAG